MSYIIRVKIKLNVVLALFYMKFDIESKKNASYHRLLYDPMVLQVTTCYFMSLQLTSGFYMLIQVTTTSY